MSPLSSYHLDFNAYDLDEPNVAFPRKSIRYALRALTSEFCGKSVVSNKVSIAGHAHLEWYKVHREIPRTTLIAFDLPSDYRFRLVHSSGVNPRKECGG